MLPVQISVRNTTLSPEVERDVRERVDRLRRYYDGIMGCRVTIDVPQGRRRSHAVWFAVYIDLTVPGEEIAVNRQPRDQLLTALDDAFKAARRRLQDYARRQRGDVKAHEPPSVASVVEHYPLAGYGFLETPDGLRVYFDRNSVLGGAFDRLAVGSEVRFTEEEGEKGPQATTVVPITRHRVPERE